MPTILHLHRVLPSRPEISGVEGIHLRTYAGPQDIEHWLTIREQAFVGEKVGVRSWQTSDFQREFLDKPWWRPDRQWFAEADDKPIGTITLARRGLEPTSKPVIHWLAVVPAWRHQGIGRLLLATLEAACWDAGEHDIHLETHAAWKAAVRLYETAGYVAE